MQLTTFVSVAAFAATTYADQAGTATSSDLLKAFNANQAYARVINRCPYDVYLWSVLKNQGCEEGNMIKLKQGGTYQENYRLPVNGAGVSIKISKTPQCKGVDITQLEYYIELTKNKDGQNYNGNYLDVSYVDCGGKDCPTMQEGYYLKSGSQTGEFRANSLNTVCPILSCTDAASCSKISYVLPDDVQTRCCSETQNLDYYMCGGEAPGAGDYSLPSKPEPKPEPKPSPAKPSSSAANYKVNAAAVTPAPQIKEPKPLKIKTAVVTVTEYQYVNAKRHDHAHAHARRHQAFHA